MTEATPARIALVGFMAAGKTTVGRLLARHLGWDFVDLDTWIERRAGLSIPELFARHGEPFFREVEREAARAALGRPRCVIATGGGAFACDATRTLLLAGARCVWLQVDLDTVLTRLERGRDRPLAADRATIPALLTLRERAYQQAHLAIATRGKPPRALALEIAEAVAPGAEGGNAMRYLILSDIHSNKEALSAVVAFVRRKPFDKVVFLGDLVGYGANPNQAIDLLRGLKKPIVAIRGNHDKVCSGIEDGELFNRIALEAAMWTRRKLTPGNLKWLKALPQGPVLVDDAFAISHGTPVDEDAYIFGEIEALNVFRHTKFEVCFFGHSHFPVVFGLSPEAITTVLTVAPTFRFKLEPGSRYLINPGSVGQPRDGNPRSSFAFYDSDARVVTIHRLDYRLAAAQDKIMKAGLPRPLADRLAIGR